MKQNLSIEQLQQSLQENFGYSEYFTEKKLQSYLQQAELHASHRLLINFFKENLFKQEQQAIDSKNKFLITLPLDAQKFISFTVDNYGSLFYWQIIGDISLLHATGKILKTITNPTSLFALLTNDLLNIADAQQSKQQLASRWQHFISEVENGIQNETLYLAYREYWHDKISKQFAINHHTNIINCLSQKDIDSFNFFIQWGAQGHPFHPNPKTKLGLSIAEVIQFSPEFASCLPINFAALHQQLVYQESVDPDKNYQKIFSEYFSEYLTQWHNQLRTWNCDPQDFVILPVHPWQFKYVLPVKFSQLINQKKLFLFEQPQLMTRPSLSVRTVMPIENAQSAKMPHLKLPVGFYITSTMRTVSPASVRMGPRISNLLINILSSETAIASCLKIIIDEAGAHYQQHADPTHDDNRFLSIILRKNPHYYLEKNEIAIPVTSLFVPAPVTRKPLLIELIEHGSNSDILQFFAKYVDCLLQGFLDLYLLYGIALEAHQQNTTVVFKDGVLQKFLNHDLGGIRIDTIYLAQQGYSLPQEIRSLTLTTDSSEARNKFIHTLIQSHLAQLVFTLTQYYSLESQQLWQIIRKQIVQRFLALKNRVSDQRLLVEQQTILEHDWFLKAFTRMRLSEQPGDIYLPNIKNPFKIPGS